MEIVADRAFGKMCPIESNDQIQTLTTLIVYDPKSAVHLPAQILSHLNIQRHYSALEQRCSIQLKEQNSKKKILLELQVSAV